MAAWSSKADPQGAHRHGLSKESSRQKYFLEPALLQPQLYIKKKLLSLTGI